MALAAQTYPIKPVLYYIKRQLKADMLIASTKRQARGRTNTHTHTHKLHQINKKRENQSSISVPTNPSLTLSHIICDWFNRRPIIARSQLIKATTAANKQVQIAALIEWCKHWWVTKVHCRHWQFPNCIHSFMAILLTWSGCLLPFHCHSTRDLISLFSTRFAWLLPPC